MALSSRPTYLEVAPMKFVIMDAPRQTNLHVYVKELQKYQVQHVVRVCEPTYHADALVTAGITLHDWEYPDGHSPPPHVLQNWLDLVYDTFFAKSNNKADSSAVVAESLTGALAVHCVAGLGRAPVLVAIALVEFANMDAVEAVMLIRKHRRGAINEKQLLYLEGYKRHYKAKKRPAAATTESGCQCVIL